MLALITSRTQHSRHQARRWVARRSTPSMARTGAPPCACLQESYERAHRGGYNSACAFSCYNDLAHRLPTQKSCESFTGKAVSLILSLNHGGEVLCMAALITGEVLCLVCSRPSSQSVFSELMPGRSPATPISTRANFDTPRHSQRHENTVYDTRRLPGGLQHHTTKT